jgi:hypothetical protein
MHGEGAAVTLLSYPLYYALLKPDASAIQQRGA